MEWLAEYDLGIKVIDDQHKRIVDYINELEKAKDMGNSGFTSFALNGLLDYTLTHFQFEEKLQEKAGYPYLKAHKRIHAIFIKRIASFRERFNGGENVTEELLDMLRTWLVGHIKGDDRDYRELFQTNIMRDPNWADLAQGVPA